jgi:hypothetical protein
VRVFGCCPPIPLGLGLLSMGGLALLVRRQGGNRPGYRDLLNPTCSVKSGSSRVCCCRRSIGTFQAPLEVRQVGGRVRLLLSMAYGNGATPPGGRR